MKNSQTIPAEIRDTILFVLNNCHCPGLEESKVEAAIDWARSAEAAIDWARSAEANPFASIDDEVTAPMDPSQLAWLTLVSVEEDELAPEMHWFDLDSDD